MSDEEKTEFKLTGKMKAFADHYIGGAHFNATKAALLAGYSEKTAFQIGYENLKKPEIRGYIKFRLSELTLTENEVLSRLTEHANGTIADILTEDGEFDYADMIRRGKDHLIKKLKVKRTTRKTKDGEEVEDLTHEFEMHDAQAATVHIGKYHKLFTEKIEHGGTVEHNITGKLDLAIDKVYGDSDSTT